MINGPKSPYHRAVSSWRGPGSQYEQYNTLYEALLCKEVNLWLYSRGGYTDMPSFPQTHLHDVFVVSE